MGLEGVVPEKDQLIGSLYERGSLSGIAPEKEQLAGSLHEKSGLSGSVTIKEVVYVPGGNVPGGEVGFDIDETLSFKDGVLSVNTTNDMEQDNTLPITSAGVYATVGNIEALLKTI